MASVFAVQSLDAALPANVPVTVIAKMASAAAQELVKISAIAQIVAATKAKPCSVNLWYLVHQS